MEQHKLLPKSIAVIVSEDSLKPLMQQTM